MTTSPAREAPLGMARSARVPSERTLCRLPISDAGGDATAGASAAGLGDQVRAVVGAARRAHRSSVLLWHDFEAAPVDLLITLLELGYRCWVRTGANGVRLFVDPDGSVPRDGWRDKSGSSTHSLVSTDEGHVYSITTADRVVVLDASSRSVLDYVRVGSSPEHVVVSPDGRWLFSANCGSDDVTVVDLGDHLRTVTATVGRGPLLPCVARDGDRAWVPSRADCSVSVVCSDGSTAATIGVGLNPHDIEVSPDGRWAYQPNQGDGTVTVIDAHSLRVEATVTVGTGPCHVTFTPDGTHACVANTLSDDVSVVRVEDHTVTHTLPAGQGTHVPIITPDGRWLVAADFISDDVFVWDATTFEPRGIVPVGRYPHGLSLSPDGHTLVVSHTGSSEVSIVDVLGPRVVAEVAVSGAPGHIAFDPDGQCAFVACERSEVVAVIDLRRSELIELVDVGNDGGRPTVPGTPGPVGGAGVATHL